MKKWWWVIIFISARSWMAISFPIFNDEAIYAQWASQIGVNFNRGLLPILMDGKMPGLMIFWSIMVGWGNDPVLMLRLTSIGFGLVTAILIFKMYEQLVGEKIRWWQQIIFITIPGMVWYEGLGLQESAVMMMGSAIVYWGLRAYKLRDWGVKQGLTLGLLLGMATLIKPTAWMSVGALIWLVPKVGRESINQKIITCLVAIGLAVFLSQTFRFHPGYASYLDRSLERRSGLTMIIQSPELMINRLASMGQWLIWWLGPLSILGVLAIGKNKDNGLLLVTTGWAGVLGASLLSGQGLFSSRYIAAAYPLLGLAGMVRLHRLKPKWGKLVVGCWSVVNILIIGYPFKAVEMMSRLPAVASDFSQYIYGWTSGWGVREAINVVRTEVGNKQGLVLVRADSGNPESAVWAYLWREPNFRVANTIMAKEIIDQKLKGELANIPIYFVSRGNQMDGLPKERLREVARFPKPKDSEYVGVYELE